MSADSNTNGDSQSIPSTGRYYRRVFQMSAECSPNVRYARAEIAAGRQPSNRVIVPGVLPWADYVKRRSTWDEILQTIGLDGQFYQGAENLLFPPQWLNYAHELHERLLIQVANKRFIRKPEAIGIDPAEGGAQTAMYCVDRYGIIERSCQKTPDTNIIPRLAIAFMEKHNVDPDRVVFDRGGGGKQHADRLRAMGYNVRTVAFGESVMHDPQRGLQHIAERKEEREERYAYFNRRAQMYGELSLLLDPSQDGICSIQGWEDGRELFGFSIPREYTILRSELAPVPRLYDPEGRLQLPPKNKRPDAPVNSTKKTLVEIIGHSPDEADALVLAVHGMLYKSHQQRAGAIR